MSNYPSFAARVLIYPTIFESREADIIQNICEQWSFSKYKNWYEAYSRSDDVTKALDGTPLKIINFDTLKYLLVQDSISLYSLYYLVKSVDNFTTPPMFLAHVTGYAKDFKHPVTLSDVLEHPRTNIKVIHWDRDKKYPTIYSYESDKVPDFLNWSWETQIQEYEQAYLNNLIG